MVYGRPKKRARNITGLRNQGPRTITPASLASITQSNVSSARRSDQESESDDEDDLKVNVVYDGLKISFEEEYTNAAFTDNESDIDEEVELDILNDEEFGRKLTEMMEREDRKESDWIPGRKRQKSSKCECLRSRIYTRSSLAL
jgi:hypothetical protein